KRLPPGPSSTEAAAATADLRSLASSTKSTVTVTERSYQAPAGNVVTVLLAEFAPPGVDSPPLPPVPERTVRFPGDPRWIVVAVGAEEARATMVAAQVAQAARRLAGLAEEALKKSAFPVAASLAQSAHGLDPVHARANFVAALVGRESDRVTR